jgi:inositol oxygenase
MTNYRQYVNAADNVKENYKLTRINQTIPYVKYRMAEFDNRAKTYMSIFETLDILSNFIDISDPDVSIPNAHHAFQTAEGARQNNEPEWFQLTCLLHDLGKIMYLWGSNKTGTSIKQQWGIVGDTYILGCKIPNTIVYPEFNKDQPNKTESILGIYDKNCGLDNCFVTWGHDEFMYRVLLNNKNTLPKEALYIIRYHSLYLWHTNNEYTQFENNIDFKMKPWVQKFNQYDLYTKENIEVSMDDLKSYYKTLIDKYFTTDFLKW